MNSMYHPGGAMLAWAVTPTLTIVPSRDLTERGLSTDAPAAVGVLELEADLRPGFVFR
jgi:hypothetical protein